MTPKQSKPKAPQKVAPISEMSKQVFCQHMSVRHLDSLGGMGDLPVTIDEYMEGVYRAFHRRLHDTRVDLEHEHEKSDNPGDMWQDG